MLVLVLLGCSSGRPIATIPNATRIAELANGELLVGTASGELWLVSSFGDTRRETGVDAPIVELVADPMARFWARTEGGIVFAGSPWNRPEQVAEGAVLLVRGCDETRWTPREQADPSVATVALARSCEDVLEGRTDGTVLGQQLGQASIVRVQLAGDGLLWVDAAGNAGCLGCGTSPPAIGVVDAQYLHLAPFVAGEIAWLDGEGGLWIEPA